jgi:hypothetical protein
MSEIIVVGSFTAQPGKEAATTGEPSRNVPDPQAMSLHRPSARPATTRSLPSASRAAGVTANSSRPLAIGC